MRHAWGLIENNTFKTWIIFVVPLGILIAILTRSNLFAFGLGMTLGLILLLQLTWIATAITNLLLSQANYHVNQVENKESEN